KHARSTGSRPSLRICRWPRACPERTRSGQTSFAIQSIPEPTSGLMLLLGAGMLTLRRKAVRA
ncbi:MAG TPA: hypothetical protein DD637_02060, partial [Verrucomicrobia bacterium]|nr:hypothetical protein [Verrucomicrobiota bacterium]